MADDRRPIVNKREFMNVIEGNMRAKRDELWRQVNAIKSQIEGIDLAIEILNKSEKEWIP